MNLFSYILVFLLLIGINTKAQFIFDKALGGGGYDVARDILFTQDGNYLVMGYGVTAVDGGLYFAKIDTSGSILWEKRYTFINSSLPNYATWQGSVFCETIDSGFVVGSKIDTGSVQMGLLIKFNALGDTVFNKSDSITLGAEVQKIVQSPDGNLLALISITGGKALVKLDNNFNQIAIIDTITTPIKDIKILNNKTYILIEDSIDNLWIIDNDMITIDTVTIPLGFPVDIKIAFDSTQLIFEGLETFSSSNRKLIYTDLTGNVNIICDSVFNDYRDDFKPTNINNDWLFMGINYDIQYGQDIQLYFTDNCGKLLSDTILYRSSFTQKLDEYGVKILVDNDGNYLLFGYVNFGVLGKNDIFLVKYKKWDFPTSIDGIDENEPTINTDFAVFPNPAQNYFTIIGLKENSSIIVLDVMGKIVYSTTNSKTSITITANHWAKGMYIIQIKNGKEYLTQKIIKTKFKQ